MKKEIPKVDFDKNKKLDIEIIDLKVLFQKLSNTKDHDPFSIHRIEFYLILVVTKNSYSHFVDFKTYKLKEGSAIFIAKNQIHHFNPELEKTQGFVIIFNEYFIDKHYFLSENIKLNRLFNYHIETPILSKKELSKDNFIEIALALRSEYNFPNDFAKSELLGSLLHTLLLKAERVKEVQSFSKVKHQWLISFNVFKKLLEKEYIQTRSSRYYASKLHISYKLLNEIVKTLTGKTVKAFIDDFVIIEIKRYLVSTSLSVKEISYKTGFEEPANMTKFFKKNTNITPLQFRVNR